ncbi:MAG: hypothetical protein ACRD07_04700 [Acidimicrobiales bacterium]
MASAVGDGYGSTEESERQTELALREALSDVDLICEADPPADLLDTAESAFRRHLAQQGAGAFATQSPASLATYVAMRGAERYEGNRLWPQLGVASPGSWIAGRAFLAALRQLGLPDFQHMVRAEKARTYVAPILIHGGLPAAHARRLVDLLEIELRRGLADGREAVARLELQQEVLTRPIRRLVHYAPEYSASLVDALIDRITGVRTGSRGIPRHIREAIEQGDPAGRRGLRRLQVPYVEFDDWSGEGPLVVCPDGDTPWTAEQDDRSIELRPGEDLVVEPCTRLTVLHAGDRRTLWNHPVTWYGAPGRLVLPEVPLPALATALVPRGWTVRMPDGREPLIVEQGRPLTGRWSHHRCITYDLNANDRVVVVPSDGTAGRQNEWRVTGMAEPVLIGERVPEVTTRDGDPVFRRMPDLRITPTNDNVPVWFSAPHQASRHHPIPPGASGIEAAELGRWLPPAPFSGRLDVRTPDSRHHDLPLTVIPGLDIHDLDAAMAPRESRLARLQWRNGPGAIAEVDVDVPGAASVVNVPPVAGIPDGLQLAVPRVRWALRSDRPARLDLASGAIAVEVDDLLGEDLRLLVRCGRPAAVSLELLVNGSRLHTGHDRETRPVGGPHHQSAFPLDRYRDTIRHHRHDTIEIRCVVDGRPMTALLSGALDAHDIPRTWTSQRHPSPPRPTADPWADVSWMTSRRHRGSAMRDLREEKARGLAHQLLRRFHQLAPGDQIVTFLRLLGEGSRTWSPTRGRRAGIKEDAWGPGGYQWATFEAVADELWRLQGVRYREYAGRPIDDSVRLWARTTRDDLNKLDKQRRSDVELWSFGRQAPLARIEQWPLTSWVSTAAPRSSDTSGVDHYPGALVYHALNVAGGDDRSGSPVAAASSLTPERLLELVALMLEAGRRGTRFSLPALRPVDSDDKEIQDDPATSEEGTATPAVDHAPPSAVRLGSLDGCVVEVSDKRVLTITPDRAVQAPLVRVWLEGRRPRAVAALRSTVDGDALVAPLPVDIAGVASLTISDPRSVPLDLRHGRRLELPDAGSPAATAGVTTSSLADIDRARRRGLATGVVDATESGAPALTQVEELFDDEVSASQVLSEFGCSNRTTPATANRVGIAVLPAAMLFGQLPLDSQAARHLRTSARVLWAALGPRDPTAWAAVAWPNRAHFGAGPTLYDDVVAFATNQSRRAIDHDPGLTTFRYAISSLVIADRRVHATVCHLDRRHIDRAFIDLAVAAYVAITVDAVAAEATRLLLHAHRTQPDATERAVLVGTSLHLASSEH